MNLLKIANHVCGFCFLTISVFCFAKDNLLGGLGWFVASNLYFMKYLPGLVPAAIIRKLTPPHGTKIPVSKDFFGA